MQPEIEPEGISRDVKRPFTSPGGSCEIRVSLKSSKKFILSNLFSQ